MKELLGLGSVKFEISNNFFKDIENDNIDIVEAVKIISYLN